jgi:hypothetical protein
VRAAAGQDHFAGGLSRFRRVDQRAGFAILCWLRFAMASNCKCDDRTAKRPDIANLSPKRRTPPFVPLRRAVGRRQRFLVCPTRLKTFALQVIGLVSHCCAQRANRSGGEPPVRALGFRSH